MNVRRGAHSAMSFADQQAEIGVWKTLMSIPAVRNNRVSFLIDDALVVPGPRVGRAVELMARAIHPDAFQ